MAIFLIIFFLGLAVGSFLNVLIDRLPRNEPVTKGRSHCESCKRKLRWDDLIPVFSFIALGGKCRYCKAPISFYYPAVELITGVLFILFFLFLQGNSIKYEVLSIKYIIQAICYLFIISSLIVVFFTDLRYGIIPDKITYFGIIVSFLYLILTTNYLILPNALSAFAAFFFFLLIFIISKGKGMGFGDVKLAFLMGLFLGFPKIIVALYVAFLTGAVISLILVLIGRKKFFGSTIPFGPFLVLGTIVALFFGNYILDSMWPFLLGK